MGREPLAVDILSEIPGADFDMAWERRIEEVIDHATGTTARILPMSTQSTRLPKA